MSIKTKSAVVNDTIWENVLETLKEQISENSFNAWLADVTPIKLEDSERTLVLSVPNELTRRWIKSNFELKILSEVMKVNQKVKNLKLVISRNAMKRSVNKRRPVLEEKNLTLELPTVERETNLNTDMTFENFVVVEYNKFAYSAAEAIMEKLGFQYNPFYVYGPTGVGKTHLLQAIGNKMKSLNPHLRVRYMTTESFKEGFISAIKKNNVDEFRKMYRSYQLFILDDVHFFQKSESVIVELFHLFNVMINNNSQIILSSDKPPSDLDKIEDRIKTRLQSGIVVDIESPTVEDMTVICKERANLLGINLTDQALEYIVENVAPNIREINGALKSVHLYISNKPNQVVDYPDIKMYVRNYIKKYMTLTHTDVIKVVCDFYNIDPNIIKTKIRRKEVVHARHVIMFILREYLDRSYALIGKEFGGRDHTTVMHSHQKINNKLQEDTKLQRDMVSIKKNLCL